MSTQKSYVDIEQLCQHSMTMSTWKNYRCLKKIAGIWRTQNSFSGFIGQCVGTCLFIDFLFSIVQNFHS